MTTPTCKGCHEPIEDDRNHTESNGEDWHNDCFEVSGGSSYCCGMMYEDGEGTCVSCGEPL